MPLFDNAGYWFQDAPWQGPQHGVVLGVKAHVYGKIDNADDLKHVYAEIRNAVADAQTRPELTTLYRRAGYLVTLTYSPAWAEKFDQDQLATLHQIAHDEFRATARAINDRAKTIATKPDYDESWGSK